MMNCILLLATIKIKGVVLSLRTRGIMQFYMTKPTVQCTLFDSWLVLKILITGMVKLININNPDHTILYVSTYTSARSS